MLVEMKAVKKAEVKVAMTAESMVESLVCEKDAKWVAKRAAKKVD